MQLYLLVIVLQLDIIPVLDNNVYPYPNPYYEDICQSQVIGTMNVWKRHLKFLCKKLNFALLYYLCVLVGNKRTNVNFVQGVHAEY